MEEAVRAPRVPEEAELGLIKRQLFGVKYNVPKCTLPSYDTLVTQQRRSRLKEVVESNWPHPA